MAVDWFKSLSTLGKTAAIAGIGGALTAGAVIGYKIYQAKQGPPPDEGFDEIPKVSYTLNASFVFFNRQTVPRVLHSFWS